MTPADYRDARALEFMGRDGNPLRPRWTEHPPGVLRAFGWYARNAIEAMTDSRNAREAFFCWHYGKGLDR